MVGNSKLWVCYWCGSIFESPHVSPTRNNNCYSGLWRIKQGHKIKGNCQLHNINLRKNLDSFISFTRCNVLMRPTQSDGSVRMGWMPIISDLGLLLFIFLPTTSTDTVCCIIADCVSFQQYCPFARLQTRAQTWRVHPLPSYSDLHPPTELGPIEC